MNRVWRLVVEHELLIKESAPYCPDSSGELTGDRLKELHRKTHETIKKVGTDIEERFHFNTAISAIMELVNLLYLFKGSGDGAHETPQGRELFREAVEAVILLLSPFAPHIAEELWARIGMEGGVFERGWPVFDPRAIEVDEIEVVVQVNGKVRSKISVATGAGKEEVEGVVMNDEKVLEVDRG